MIFALTAAAPNSVPLPPHFTSEVSRGENSFYRPVPDQRGIYAHGFAGQSWLVLRADVPCQGSKADQEAFVASLPHEGRSEFWFYASRSQGVLFTRTLAVDSSKSCASARTIEYEVERAYVADGFIHSMSVDGNNSMEPIITWPVDHSAEEYSGSFMRLHSLMARPTPNERERVQQPRIIAGVRADCRGRGGLVWSSVCTASSGPAKGMILSAAAGDDEQIMFSTEVKELRTRAVLPGQIFEIDRAWQGKD